VAVTQAQEAVMAQTANKFEAVNSQLESMLKRLLSELEILKSRWVGRGGMSFEQVKEAWARDQAILHRNLAETATAIRTSGVNYTTSDTDASSRFRGMSGSVDLPLGG
jgi:WXG100 family type VII secretion target